MVGVGVTVRAGRGHGGGRVGSQWGQGEGKVPQPAGQGSWWGRAGVMVGQGRGHGEGRGWGALWIRKKGVEGITGEGGLDVCSLYIKNVVWVDMV